MPIRINLKELFPADAQEITVDKLNFNFNKLLELGIGEQGLRGFSGVQGSPGPGGIPGPTGIRGNAWFLDAVYDPNTLTFTEPLIDGDFYLDSTTFTVWQYNGATWDFVFDLTAIINSYLIFAIEIKIAKKLNRPVKLHSVIAETFLDKPALTNL